MTPAWRAVAAADGPWRPCAAPVADVDHGARRCGARPRRPATRRWRGGSRERVHRGWGCRGAGARRRAPVGGPRRRGGRARRRRRRPCRVRQRRASAWGGNPPRVVQPRQEMHASKVPLRHSATWSNAFHGRAVRHHRRQQPPARASGGRRLRRRSPASAPRGWPLLPTPAPRPSSPTAFCSFCLFVCL